MFFFAETIAKCYDMCYNHLGYSCGGGDTGLSQQFFQTNYVQSDRILYTPSTFAKANLIYLQETGTLKALKPHISQREQLNSYLFMLVKEGKGTVQHGGKSMELRPGQCAFINCKKSYSHRCSDTDLWTLSWVHFYGANLDAIYDKFLNRGGQFAFTVRSISAYETVLKEIIHVARSDDHIRDLKLYEQFAKLLCLIFQEDLGSDVEISDHAYQKLIPLKEYLDEHYTDEIRLDDLSEQFYFNKFYLSKLFKKQFGVTINHYVIHKRITKAKELLRFSDLQIDEISRQCGIEDPAYFSRMFKKIEELTPNYYRKLWAKS